MKKSLKMQHLTAIANMSKSQDGLAFLMTAYTLHAIEG